MNGWLTDRLEASQKADKVELVFRPFLRWLDKTLEQIFTDGLTMVGILSLKRLKTFQVVKCD